jgi:hypothetical protein
MMTKEEWKNNKQFDALSREMRGGFGNPEDAGIDSAHFLNLRDSAEASFLKQQWDTKQPLEQNKTGKPKTMHTKGSS